MHTDGCFEQKGKYTQMHTFKPNSTYFKPWKKTTSPLDKMKKIKTKLYYHVSTAHSHVEGGCRDVT